MKTPRRQKWRKYTKDTVIRPVKEPAFWKNVEQFQGRLALVAIYVKASETKDGIQSYICSQIDTYKVSISESSKASKHNA